ncbi:hypothetical protein DERF_013458 [Dermatophagoides farinae]|uniref:Uncharacterized protein n=1 Tax=Dermatophagoides farinae TaxID=6954 RepID=A0A922HPK0_DERFA|nr:hypothetical protein DERF_013458 [Dermatophagoides farinae]
MNEQQQQKENFFKFNVDVQMIREYMAIITMMIKPVDYQFLLKKTVFKPDDHNNDVRGLSDFITFLIDYYYGFGEY